ncbi:MAG: translation initiation factor IF-2 [Acidobacteria bacterium]|nr:translation initiation factor IF-2 [Acidobacteriota bacterium]
MKKIRINELARELEVKPHRILDLLAEFGVTEKKTHSSSIDEEVAVLVRARILGQELPMGSPNGAVAAETQEVSMPELQTPPEPALPPGPPAETVRPAEQTAEAPAPDAQAAPPDIPAAGRLGAVPIRPPLASGPREPLTPPTAATTPGSPVRPPAQPAPQARPVPQYRPGQVISGPRQPLPPSETARTAAGAAPPPRVVPGTPIAPPPPSGLRPGSPRQPAPGISIPKAAPPAQVAPGTQPQQRPGTIVGQPAARPVVPPRPDLVARLQQARPGPAQPAAPRPGMPTPRPAPTPGQPIFRGPIRPGQPLVRTPGAPAPGAPGRQLRRPMHPTTLRPDQVPPPPTQARRPAKPARDLQRERDQEREQKLRMYQPRREQPDEQLAAGKEITVAEGITVKELSEKLGLKAGMVVKKLVDRKIFATINQTLDVKLAGEVARSFGANANQISFEQEAVQDIEQTEIETDLVTRAPVVTIMGHVDHGKTSLLDAIRNANVADREAGGITQHIGAYEVQQNGRKVVFIDTPGHEAFTRMRARGAKVTDIVVLVVAADDGVMPQTLEAIDHARAAKVPIIAAVNKIDKPDAQPERIKQQLADRGLLAEDWGGDTVMVPVSAKTQQNLDLMLEMILLVADLQNLRANPARPAIGTVLEAKLDRGRGPVATVLVQNGTLRVGDFFICGQVFGKVRALYNDRGEQVKEAEPATPVEVLGLADLPEVGDNFQVVTDTAKAKQIVMYREIKAREQAMAKGARITLEQLHEQAREGGLKDLNIVLKTDVGGTAEVLSEMLQKLSTEKIKVRVLHKNVGAITETDVLLASASNAIIIGFNVRPERSAQSLAEKESVDIRLHTIIYELTDEIKKAMTGMLEPVFKEVFRGRATVQQVFRISKIGTVAGCLVNEGAITRDSQVRLLRDNVVIYTGRIDSLKRFKNDVSEVKSGFECGISIAGYSDIKENDVIEAFAMERLAPQL